MARSLNGSTQYLEHAAAAVTVPPLTLAAWARSDDATISQDVLCVGTSSTVSAYRLNFGGATAGDPARAITHALAGASIAVSSTGYSVNTWHHVAAVFASTTDRRAFIDGGSKGTDAASRSLGSTPNRTAVGRYVDGAAGQAYFSGQVAEAAIWSAALEDAEVAALARGVSPRRVRPGSLVAYWPLWGLHSPEIGLVAGLYPLTVTGATAAAHAPVAPFSRRWWGSMPAIEEAAPPGPSPALLRNRTRTNVLLRR